MTAKEINKILRRYIPSGTVLGTTREKLIYELQDLQQREVNKLNLPDVIQRSEQLNAFREFAKQNYQGLALFSLEEIMDEYLKSI